jgi:hypothetical protein
MGTDNDRKKLPLSNIAVASVGLVVFGLLAFGLYAGAGAVVLGFLAKAFIDRGYSRGLGLALVGIWGGAISCGLYLFLTVTDPKPPPPAPVPILVTTWPGLAAKIFDRLDDLLFAKK